MQEGLGDLGNSRYYTTMTHKEYGFTPLFSDVLASQFPISAAVAPCSSSMHVTHVTNLSLMICPTDSGPSIIFIFPASAVLSTIFFSHDFVKCLDSWDACHTPVAV